jgi:hypothetical protein
LEKNDEERKLQMAYDTVYDACENIWKTRDWKINNLTKTEDALLEHLNIKQLKHYVKKVLHDEQESISKR